MGADDGSQSAAELIGKLTQGGARQLSSEDIKHTTALIKQIQVGVEAQGTRSAARLDKLIDVGKYVGSLVFLIAAFVVFFAYCPTDKRYDLIEKLIPLVAGLFGGFGLAKLKGKGSE